ncbi:GtrA family protein [Corynebacterium incognita]|uniref:GtrA family protein n=1 Tax=Corynebacterium incognita TaxID=2754725 RepID=UPI001FEB0350|nr:GtrA family protein [Corynebacterium incognita]
MTEPDVEVKGTSLRTQLTRFVGVGIFTALLDWGLTMLLINFGVPRGSAKAVGWVFGTIAAYLANARFTFGSKVSGRTAVAVGLLYLSTFLVQNIMFRITEAPLVALGLEGGVMNTVSYVIAQGVATITNFAIQRAFIFKAR